MLLACDPGVHAYGLAWFSGDNVLVSARLTPAERLFSERAIRVDWVAVERQYVTFKHPRPQDIVELAFAAGYFKGLFADLPCKEYLPTTWKGSVPKKIHQKRIISRLSEEEKRICSGSNHNVIDAIGIGLYALGRLRVTT